MQVLNTVKDWFRQQGAGEITRLEALAGGCINDTLRIFTANQTVLVLKQLPDAPDNFFAAEAAGLRALAATASLRVPQVIHVDAQFLLLEDLGNGSAGRDYWQNLGSGLAALHAQAQPSFGFTADNYCGRTPQQNPPMTDGFAFFARYRLLALGRQAQARGLLTVAELALLEKVADRLPDWIPQQAPALLHGDLWSGNVHCDARGQAALIDPACYWGWPEAELAMTTLFGAFAADFYRTYSEASGMAHDWRERASLYNLYHLLNHLLLFGGSYHAQVLSILQRYGGRS